MPAKKLILNSTSIISSSPFVTKHLIGKNIWCDRSKTKFERLTKQWELETLHEPLLWKANYKFCLWGTVLLFDHMKQWGIGIVHVC